MNDVVKKMLGQYNCQSDDDYENALKEIIQELALCGLSNTNLFDVAAFYGGTALRILYKLPRFSEDMDFTLINPTFRFDWENYLETIQKTLEIYGFKIEIAQKEKTKQTAIESAFLKANTLEAFFNIEQEASVPVNQKLQIRLEMDTRPPQPVETTFEALLLPTPFSVRTPLKSYLFAGKMHATLCHKWANKGKDRVKGRDWYDLIWCLKEKIPLNLKELEARMKQTNDLSQCENMDKALFLARFEEASKNLNIEAAKEDVLPFVIDTDELNYWSNEFFKSLSRLFTFED